MYKRLPKPPKLSSSSSDDLPHDEIPVKKPILGIYMVGYGIALIICGLSSAVNMRGYAGMFLGLYYCVYMLGVIIGLNKERSKWELFTWAWF